MSESPIQLQVGTASYGGWERVRICTGLEQLAGVFELGVSDKWAGQPVVRPIAAGSRSTILLDGKPLITGYIDQVKIEREEKDHSISFSGRDATGDLVDCIIEQPVQILNLKLDAIANKLCAPFGIKVKVQGSVGDKWPTVKAVCGERVFETLSKLAQERGVILTSDGLGNLVVGQPGVTKAAGKIVLGKNVLKSSGRVDLKERFSKYLVWAQLPGAQEAPNMDVEGSAIDSTMQKIRYRPTGSECEAYGAPTYCMLRANWMRAVAASRSQEITYTVPGWKARGQLWRFNTVVSVTDSDYGLKDTECLIKSVTYNFDDAGMTTDITVTGKDAYDVLAVPDMLLLQTSQ